MDRKLKNTYIVLLAGGKGLRFWPLSQKDKPKQFLKLFGRDSLLAATIKRIKKVVSLNQIYVVVNKNHVSLLKKELANLKLPKNNILIEPEGKNTAPAIGWAAVEISRHNPRAVMVVSPCDHLIKGTNNFYKDLVAAVEMAKEEKLVVFGVKPTRIETGYGYIISSGNYKIERFIEKPNKKLAARLIKDRRCFWNSGIFVWEANVILKEIKSYKPDLFKALIQKKWNKIKPVSIDVAVLERSRNIVMLPAHFNWQDLGSWQAWSEVVEKDGSGNYFSGNCKDLDSKNISVLNTDSPLTTIGLRDLIIVNTKNGLLVCRKDRTQDIKRIIG